MTTINTNPQYLCVCKYCRTTFDTICPDPEFAFCWWCENTVPVWPMNLKYGEKIAKFRRDSYEILQYFKSSYYWQTNVDKNIIVNVVGKLYNPERNEQNKIEDCIKSIVRDAVLNEIGVSTMKGIVCHNGEGTIGCENSPKNCVDINIVFSIENSEIESEFA